jgi:hypothetical protein
MFTRYQRAAVLALPLVIGLAGVAQAAQRHMEEAGGKLAVDSSCAATVSIEPDSGLSGRVILDATADHPEELAQLVMETDGDTAKLQHSDERCFRSAGLFWTPTLKIAIRVPAGTAIAVDEGGGVHYTIGAVGGPLALDLSGGVQLEAAAAKALNLDLSGGGRVSIHQVAGPVTVDVSGGGTLKVDQVTIPALALEVSGGGGVTFGGGKIDTVKIDLSGGGTVHIGATVGDAAVEVSGGGSVAFARVTGHMDKDVSGAGEVTVGE